ncbi:MAG TPA: T9SS type A sorting domain-containing protein [Bacteroidia bacterium]|nr:T9SS type A sorting domain-containing protein [Bacteroidia bacterium]
MKKIKYVCVFFTCFIHFVVKCQIVFNNGAIINVNGGTSNTASAYVILNNPTATPIIQMGTTTSQGIMLENEWNRLVYYLGSGTTSITVPYISNTTGSWVPFPLTMRGITAGTNAGGKTGAIRFSSRKAATLSSGYDNTGYEPNQVGNMYGSACSGNNSANVVDRFWVIQPVYYSTRPAVTLDFTYIMSETDVNGGNTAGLASSLQPQRFDTVNTTSPTCGWNGFPTTAAEFGTNTPAGSITATSVGTLTNVAVSSTNFYPDWTLANALVPLPIKLLDYKGECTNGHPNLKWVTSNEINSLHFTVERSTDGLYFSEIAKVPAAGNSTMSKHYSFTDNSTGEGTIVYYKLTETDRNGKSEVLNTISVEKCTGNIVNESGSVFSPDNQHVVVNLLSGAAQNVSITAYDITGRLVLQDAEHADEGNNTFRISTDVSPGIYLFEIKTGSSTIIKKIIIDNKN